MTRINLFAKISFLVIAIIFCAIPQCSSILSDKRLCYDPKCSEPISLARSTLMYNAGEHGMLSVPISAKVTVYSKGAGKRQDLWGIEFNGKRGYMPASFLKEYKVFKTNLNYEVPIEIVNNNKNNKNNNNNNNNSKVDNLKDIPLKKEESKPESVPTYSSPSNTNIDASIPNSNEESTSNTEEISELYNVILGTTIYANEGAFIDTSYAAESTAYDIKPTVTQTELNTSTKVSKAQEAAGTEESNVIPAGVPEVRNESDTPESGSNKENNANSLTIELEAKKKKDDVSSSVLELEDKEKEISVNSSNSVAEEKKETEGADSSVLESENKEKEISVNSSNSVPEEKKETEGADSSVLESENKEKEISVNSSNSVAEEKKETEGADSSVLESENKEKKISVNSSNSVAEEKKKTDADSSVLESEHKEKEISINSSNSVPEEKKETDSTNSTALESEHKEKEVSINSSNSSALESEHKEKEVNVQSSNVNDGAAINTADVNAKEDNVLSKDNGLENKKETVIPSVTVEHTNNADTLLPEPKLQTQVELQSEEKHINETYAPKDTASQEERSEPADESEKVLDIVEPVELQTVIEDNVPRVDVSKDVCNNNLYKEDTTCDVNKNEGNDETRVENGQASIVNNDVHNVTVKDISSSIDVPMESRTVLEANDEESLSKTDEKLSSSQNDKKDVIAEQVFHEFRSNRNLLHVEEQLIPNAVESTMENLENGTGDLKTETLPEYEAIISAEDKVLPEVENGDEDEDEEEDKDNKDTDDLVQSEETTLSNMMSDMEFSDVCTLDNHCSKEDDDYVNYGFASQEKESVSDSSIIRMIRVEHTYWVTLLYLTITAITTLIFSLGYYYIENMRRDSQLIAKINKLEKELLLSTKECLSLDENLKSTKNKLNSMQDESFGSNEMVSSLKADLEASQNTKAELEDQVAMLEKDLESATEAGLELERMLREVLSSNNEVNPLAQSVEDLQARLNAQQSANESLTNALNIKTQENETLLVELAAMKKKYEELDTELIRVTEDFKIELNKKTKIEEDLKDVVQQLELKISQLAMDKTNLYKELRIKETEVKDLVEVINQVNSHTLDIDKLYEVSHIKAEASQLLEERDELKIRLSEVEGAHNLLEEHVKVVKEEVTSLSEQCKLAEKEKRDAETRLEVISNFFKEKEAQRQKEEALWLQKQGEVMSTVERIQTMQNELEGYKQQIEVLKREIVEQEREYKSQIFALEIKAHDQWVTARQNERRLEESKAEAGQLRNRLTLIEKNLNDADADTKLHRLGANGETTTSPPLFLGAESSSSPLMFTGSSGVPPPPPASFMPPPSLFPSYLAPPLPSSGSGLGPYDVGQRPPPLGGRLSSPPPIPLHPPPLSGRYENADSPPPLISPPLLPPFNHRSHPPPPFASDHIHHPPPPPPPPSSILLPPLGTSHSWGEETLPPPRNSGFHPHQRERARNHKGSLHSSGESLDKSHHSGKV